MNITGESGFTAALRRGGTLASITLLIVIFRDAFGGAIKYYLDTVHAGPVWFIGDVLLGATVVLGVPLFAMRAPANRFIVLAILASALMGAGVGLLRGWPVTSVISTSKALLPFYAMVLTYDPRVGIRPWAQKWLVIIALIAFGFLLADIFIDFPWKGQKIEQFGIIRQASREWFILGKERPAGAASSSFAISAALAGAGLFAFSFSNKLWVKFFWLCVIFAGGWISTTRAIQVAAVVGAAVWGLVLLRQQRLASVATASLVFASAALPTYYAFTARTGLYDGATQKQFASLFARMAVMWPSAIERISVNGLSGYVFGNGWGGAGLAAVYRGWFDLFAAIDNGFLYAWTMFGIAAFIGWGVFVRAALGARNNAVVSIAVAAAVFAAQNLESGPMLILTAAAVLTGLHMRKASGLSAVAHTFPNPRPAASIAPALGPQEYPR